MSLFLKKLSLIMMVLTSLSLAGMNIAYGDESLKLGEMVEDNTNPLSKSATVKQGLAAIDTIMLIAGGLLALVCFIYAGNMAKQGQMQQALYGAIGGIIAIVASFLVRSLMTAEAGTGTGTPTN